MLWVDQAAYFGPDRRKARGGLRLRERRRCNQAGRPPCVRTALRQLQMRVIDARGPDGLAAFRQRTQTVALLAEFHGERNAARILAGLAAALAHGGAPDAHERIYGQIERARLAVHG